MHLCEAVKRRWPSPLKMIRNVLMTPVSWLWLSTSQNYIFYALEGNLKKYGLLYFNWLKRIFKKWRRFLKYKYFTNTIRQKNKRTLEGEVYCSEYAETTRVSFTSHQGRRWQQRKQRNNKMRNNGIKVAIVSKAVVAITWSKVTVAAMWANNGLVSSCSNYALQQWRRVMLVA